VAKETLRTQQPNVSVRNVVSLDLEGAGKTASIENGPPDETPTRNLVLAGEILDLDVARFIGNEIVENRGNADGCSSVHNEGETAKSSRETARRKNPVKVIGDLELAIKLKGQGVHDSAGIEGAEPSRQPKGWWFWGWRIVRMQSGRLILDVSRGSIGNDAPNRF